MSVKDMVYDHERRITVMSNALHCLKLEVRDLKRDMNETSEIIRCKDCKYLDVYKNRSGDTIWTWCKKMSVDCLMPDDFCSRGEKRDEID